MNTTNLQGALIEAGITALTFNATASGITRTIPVQEIPDESLIRVLQYGKRLFNDTINRSKDGDKPTSDTAQEWFAALKTGTLGEASGPRGNPLETAMREVLVAILRGQGLKAKAATEAAKDMDATLLKLSKGDANRMREAKAKIEAKAKEIMEARKGIAIEI